MRAFLLYIVENQVTGRTEKLKEQSIGSEVLGRHPDYNPMDDNIVRVRAHELRTRLEKHFASEGVNEPFVITIPKGGYSLAFSPRESVPAAEAAAEPVTEDSDAARFAPDDVDLAPIAPPWKPRWLWPVFAGVVVASILGSSLITRSLVSSRLKALDPEPSGVIRDFWGQMFVKPDQELKVVYADTSFALWQDLNGKTLDLGDYLNRKYLDVKDNQLFNVAMRRVTTPADMTLSVNLATLAGRFSGHERTEFARDADSDFFHDGNVVLIGSHRSNPWVSLYEPSMNFQLDQDPQTNAPLFRNRAPQANEAQSYAIPAMYDTQRVEERTYASYGVVALLKGCRSRGFTVLAEGLNTQATLAAGDFVTDPQRLESLLRSIGQRPGTDVPSFEALFQITSLPGGYDNPKVIAYRIRRPDACVGG
jgi:hypothetical protein